MAVSAKLYVSEPMSSDAIESAIRGLPSILRALIGEEAIVTASYDYGSGLHPDLCYIPMNVGLHWIDRFIADSIRQEIVQPCRSDFSICVPDGRLEVEYCHEGHIHVAGNDAELVARLREVHPYSRLKELRSHT